MRTITWYVGASLVEGEGINGRRGFSEIIDRGTTKMFYIMKQEEPKVVARSDDLDESICNFFKLGYATSTKSRLSAISTDNPFEVRLILEYETPQPKTLEYLAHHFFQEYHHFGEWFVIPELLMESFIGNFNMFVQESEALGYTKQEGRMLYDHRMFLEEKGVIK